MTSLIPYIPRQDMEDGRMLIIAGRSWLDLTSEDIERGARAVVRDCTYRAEIARCALRYAEEIGDGHLLTLLRQARDRLNAKRCVCGKITINIPENISFDDDEESAARLVEQIKAYMQEPIDD